jgi:uncharacterized protein
MRIWIDLTNAPHVNFFKPFIEKWKTQNGVDIIITTRNLSNTNELVKQNNWDYKEIGGHAGKNIIKKVLYFPFRVFLLRHYLNRLSPDIGISHSSFYSPLVCKLLGIPSIYLNDNEYAKGNYFAFMFSSITLLPEFLKEKSSKLGWCRKYNISFYPGIKEGIYLSQMNLPIKELPTKKIKKQIYFRPEPTTAEYYGGRNYFLGDLIKELKEEYDVVILPRNEKQVLHYKNEEFNGVTVAEDQQKFEEIYLKCDLFIGAGGSMTRELAYLGIPSISIYQDELLEVDKYLIKHGIMHHYYNLKKSDIDRIINCEIKTSDKILLKKGIDSYNMINKLIKEYAKN